MSKKISMFLMNQKGFYVLSEFVKNYSPGIIESIIGSDDHAVEKDYNLEIKSLCFKYQIPYYNKEDFHPVVSDYNFAIGWRWVINTEKKLIIFHDSLLPKYRGFNPLVTSLINGDKKIGVTALFASDKYDAGDIIMQCETWIDYPIKIQEAIEKISPLYFNLVKSLTDAIVEENEIMSFPQALSQVTYSLWRDELDYKIDWGKDAHLIKRFIDAVGYPYKGAYTFIGHEKIHVLSVEVLNDVEIENRTPGKIIFLEAGTPVVVCGKGLLRITSMTDNMKNTKLPLEKFRVRFV